MDLKVVRHQDTLWLGLNGQYEAIFPLGYGKSTIKSSNVIRGRTKFNNLGS